MFLFFLLFYSNYSILVDIFSKLTDVIKLIVKIWYSSSEFMLPTKFLSLFQDSDGEKSDQDLVVDVANEVGMISISIFLYLYETIF